MSLYLKYASIVLRSQMQYKASFVMSTIGQFLVAFTSFLGMYFMFDRFHAVNGFIFSEVLLCAAAMLAAFSLAECFVRGFDSFDSIIGNGEFDRIMVRPRNEILQVLASRIEFSRIGRFVQALAMLIYAIPRSGVVWSADKVLTLALMVIGGICVFSGLFIVYAALCFFTLEGLEFMNIFTDGAKEFGQYPLKIYGEGVLRILTYVVPIALFQYYPFLYLVGRTNNFAYALLPLLAVFFLVPCLLFWKFGVRHYKSTGS